MINIPDFWITRLPQIESFLKKVKKGKISTIGKSAGNIPIYCYTNGKGKNILRTSNYSAGMASGHPETFFGKVKDPRQTLMIISGIHGHEVEAMASMVNLINILETGKDLLERRWDNIISAAKKIRLVIIPVANPDGRTRVKIDAFMGLGKEDICYWGQGVWKNGKLIGWPDCKRFQPLPKKKVKFMGGYPNEDGVNIQHDATPGNIQAPETKALLDLSLKETPDCILNLHSCKYGPFLIVPTGFVPEAFEQRELYIWKKVFKALSKANLRPQPHLFKKPDFPNINSLFHYTCGALTLIFEGPHGILFRPYTFKEMIDCRLVLIETLLLTGAKEGFKSN